MSTSAALQSIVAFGILLFAIRPISGLILDLFKVMLVMSLTGLVLQVVPLKIIDTWSHQAAGWAHVSATYVPVIALLAVVWLTTVNIQMLRGKPIEQVLRGVLYVIGGVFSVGNHAWIQWDGSVTKMVIGIIGIATNTLNIFSSVVNP